MFSVPDNCYDDEFDCGAPGDCVDLSWVCDGEADCSENDADEDPEMCGE